MKSSIVIIFLLLLLSQPLFPHNEFYKRELWQIEGEYYYFLSPFDPVPLNEAVKWYGYGDLEIDQYFGYGSYPPWLQNVDDHFKNALLKWEYAVFDIDFTFDRSDGIDAYFETELAYFSDPIFSSGTATHCMEDGWLVTSCNSIVAQLNDPVLPGYPVVTQSRVVFNNTTSFGLVWSVEEDVSELELDFRYVVKHEFGHVMGLWHCLVNDNSIMYYPLHLDDGNEITQHDKDNMISLIAHNPVTSLPLNPLSLFKNRHHSFFEHDPEVLIYSQKKPGNSDKNEKSPNQTTSPYSEKNLFTIPKSETYKQEYLEGTEK